MARRLRPSVRLIPLLLLLGAPGALASPAPAAGADVPAATSAEPSAQDSSARLLPAPDARHERLTSEERTTGAFAGALVIGLIGGGVGVVAGIVGGIAVGVAFSQVPMGWVFAFVASGVMGVFGGVLLGLASFAISLAIYLVAGPPESFIPSHKRRRPLQAAGRAPLPATPETAPALSVAF